MDTNNFEFKFITSIEQISRCEWNSLVQSDYPFIQYDYLQALESSGCVNPQTGWQPNHLIVHLNKQVVALMPLYIKNHSYGEYVFDFQWANAFHQSGLNYYPKLLSAIPFTPCAGERLCIKSEYRETLQPLIIEQLVNHAKRQNIGSWHLLFPENDLSTVKQHSGLMQRLGMQYRWFNKNYQSFSEFLAGCKMKQRKNIKRERRTVADSKVKLRVVEGSDITQALWEDFFYFYQRTYAKRSGNIGYLNQRFFESIGRTMAASIVMVVASLETDVIAASLFFKSKNALYGRYWGASAEFEFLHFEACYYQGIEYCISQGLEHFDAGAQGEHKIPRGFEPIETYSYHWIADEQFRRAISNFVDQEALVVKDSINELKRKLPYRR